jgi:hypothetical protein
LAVLMKAAQGFMASQWTPRIKPSVSGSQGV